MKSLPGRRVNVRRVSRFYYEFKFLSTRMMYVWNRDHVTKSPYGSSELSRNNSCRFRSLAHSLLLRSFAMTLMLIVSRYFHSPFFGNYNDAKHAQSFPSTLASFFISVSGVRRCIILSVHVRICRIKYSRELLGKNFVSSSLDCTMLRIAKTLSNEYRY